MIALFSEFFVFNIHYTYTFLNHNMLRVLLLILKISINMHLTASKIPIDGYWWPGMPLRITLTVQTPIVEGWSIWVQTYISNIVKSFGDLPQCTMFTISQFWHSKLEGGLQNHMVNWGRFPKSEIRFWRPPPIYHIFLP